MYPNFSEPKDEVKIETNLSGRLGLGTDHG